jgi:hypothetical protein
LEEKKNERMAPMIENVVFFLERKASEKKRGGRERKTQNKRNKRHSEPSYTN